jgi:hypothetical protein
MPGPRLFDLWAELNEEMQPLRELFGPSERNCETRALFDELLAANEIGIALEVLCDWLIATPDAVITPQLLDTVSSLATKMGMGNDYVTLLKLLRK